MDVATPFYMLASAFKAISQATAMLMNELLKYFGLSVDPTVASLIVVIVTGAAAWATGKWVLRAIALVLILGLISSLFVK